MKYLLILLTFCFFSLSCAATKTALKNAAALKQDVENVVCPKCPEHKVVKTTKEVRVEVPTPVCDLQPVFFDFDSYRIDDNPAAQSALQANAACLRAKGTGTIEIGGYASEEGSAEYNMALSEMRADAASKYIRALGYSGDMHLVPWGESSRWGERPYNRRVMIEEQ